MKVRPFSSIQETEACVVSLSLMMDLLCFVQAFLISRLSSTLYQVPTCDLLALGLITLQ